MSRGSQSAAQRDDRGEGLLERRTRREHRPVAGLHAGLDRTDAHPDEHAVVVRGIGAPAPAGRRGRAASRASGTARCRRRRRRRRGGHRGAGRRRGRRGAEPSVSRQSTTSRPATVRSRVRPVGTSADAAATSQPWVGRRSAARQGGLDAGGLGVAPGAAQVVGGRLGEVAHRDAVAHLLTPGPVGAEQAHAVTLTPSRPCGPVPTEPWTTFVECFECAGPRGRRATLEG